LPNWVTWRYRISPDPERVVADCRGSGSPNNRRPASDSRSTERIADFSRIGPGTSRFVLPIVAGHVFLAFAKLQVLGRISGAAGQD
jgi:hypothetical protein